jgi:twinkle protein
LRQELCDRLGIENCLFLEFEGCKDANEYLIKEDVNRFREAVKNVKEFPLEGSFTISDIGDDIFDLYTNGLDMGVNNHIPNFNLRFVKGYITTVTGIPSHGKSDFLDYICLSLHRQAGWKGAFYSPENKPTQLHFSKMARKILGKSWIGDNKMTWEEVQKVGTYLDSEVFFIKPEKDFTIESILKSVKILKRRYGLDYFVIDAWNKLPKQTDVKVT